MKKAVFFMVLFCVSFPSCDQTANDEGIIGDITRALIVSNYPEANIWMDTTWAALMPGIEFDTWTWPDSVPTRKQLDAYDVVLLYEDGTDSYPDSLGNVMYDYVMNGGNLVLATFYWQDRSTDGST
ncbi:MAG: hypothetical protein KDC45_09955, partial [Bacteroidetes bacterium]|nr:hypothetical protein [Bacteroidota bacterium]